MTFQARRLSSRPVTNCLTKSVPQQHNSNKPFARSRGVEQTLPIKVALGCLQLQRSTSVQRATQRAERHGEGGCTPGAVQAGFGLALSYHTGTRPPLCPTSVPGETDREPPEKRQQRPTGKEQVGGSVLTRLHMRNEQPVPRPQPSLAWGALSGRLQAGNAPSL